MTRNNSDNLFGPTQYIVDSNPAQGSYSTIQSAINALNAAGNFGTIIIRSGIYTENLSFVANQQIIGMSGEGRAQNSCPVKIVGNHTFLGAGSPGRMLLQSIFFESSAGDTFTVTSNGANGIVFALKYCQVKSTAGSSVTLNTVLGGSFVTGVLFESTINASGSGFIVNSDNCQVITYLSSIDVGDTAIRMLGADNSFRDTKSEVSGTTNTISFSQASQSAFLDGTLLKSSGSTILYGAAATTTALHCTHESFSGTGNYIDGAAGIYLYADDILTGPAINIAAGITQSPFDWKPYCTAGTSVTAVRGTAGFDSPQFTTTNGFVTLTNGQTGIAWSTVSASSLVSPNTGSFALGDITLTLPAAPLQGQECRFFNKSGTVVIIQASGAQQIRISSMASSTATSSITGDGLWLTYDAGAVTWFGLTVGSWSVP